MCAGAEPAAAERRRETGVCSACRTVETEPGKVQARGGAQNAAGAVARRRNDGSAKNRQVTAAAAKAGRWYQRSGGAAVSVMVARAAAGKEPQQEKNERKPVAVHKRRRRQNAVQSARAEARSARRCGGVRNEPEPTGKTVVNIRRQNRMLLVIHRQSNGYAARGGEVSSRETA